MLERVRKIQGEVIMAPKSPKTDAEARDFAVKAAKRLRRIPRSGTTMPTYLAALDRVQTLADLHAAMSAASGDVAAAVAAAEAD